MEATIPGTGAISPTPPISGKARRAGQVARPFYNFSHKGRSGKGLLPIRSAIGAALKQPLTSGRIARPGSCPLSPASDFGRVRL